MTGYNRETSEYHGAREYTTAEEASSFAGNPEAKELNAVEEPSATPRPAKKKKRAGLGITTLFAAAAVAVTAGVVMLSPAGAKAEIVSATATDTEIAYEVVISSDEALEIVLFNDFTRRAYPLQAGENSGVFTNLHAGAEYTVAVVGNFGFGEQKLARQTVKTAKEPPAPVPVSEWYGIETECRCAIDHYFYFRMDFVDEKGIYSNFEATLTDAYGNISACVFGEDLHGWQRIDVNGTMQLRGKTAQFRLSYRSRESGEIVYEEQVNI